MAPRKFWLVTLHGGPMGGRIIRQGAPVLEDGWTLSNPASSIERYGPGKYELDRESIDYDMLTIKANWKELG